MLINILFTVFTAKEIYFANKIAIYCAHVHTPVSPSLCDTSNLTFWFVRHPEINKC